MLLPTRPSIGRATIYLALRNCSLFADEQCKLAHQ